MAAMIEVKCKKCKQPFMARVADRKRGWAKFCSKSCKAKEQEKRTGQHANYKYNYRGSGVSKEKFVHYAKEHGGTPVFHPRTGDYEGFMPGPFDNTEHQNDPYY